jgi:iron complex outermembrane receptor protein
VFVTPPGVLVSEPARTFLDLNDDFLTWKAQLEYQPVDDVLLYAGYNRGVKAGSFTAPLDGLQPVSALTFRPEVLDSFEVGTKADFLDRRLRLNLSAFYYDYKDYQGFVFSGITTVVKNFPATIYGGEVELTARPVDGLEARAGLSLLNARVKHVEVSPDVFAKQHMVLAPDVSANWLLRYEHPAGPGTMSVQYDGSYSGRQYYNTINVSARASTYFRLDRRSATLSASSTEVRRWRRSETIYS